MRRFRSVRFYAAVSPVAGCAAEPAPVADPATQEQAIRAVDQQMLTGAQSKDAAAFAAVFAPDGQLLFPNSPAVTGRDAIQAQAARDFATPDFTVSWEASRYIIAESGDLAASIGTYQLSGTSPAGPFQDHGKYMTLWRKVDGQWLAAADMINTDVPLPAPDSAM